MAFATVADRDAIENEMPWAARDVPVTTYGLITQTADKHGSRKGPVRSVVVRRPQQSSPQLSLDL